MKRITILVLVLILLLTVASCASRSDNIPGATNEITRAEPTPVPPWQGAVPGAAPNFNAEQREPFNLVASFRDTLFLKSAVSWTRQLQLNQGGSIWFSALIIFLVAFDFKNWKSRRNIDLLLLLVPSIFLVDITLLGNTSDVAQSRLFGFLYLGLFLSTLVLLVRALMRAFEASESKWSANIARSILIGLTIFLILVNVLRTLIYNPNDSGHYTNIGAYRMLVTGKFPYGDDELRGGAAATYGPILYISHIPFQLLLKPITNQFTPGEDSLLRKMIVGGDDLYAEGPPVLATKLVVIFFQFIGVLGLYLIGRQMASSDVGWGLACLYVSSPYVMGLGGRMHSSGG